MTPKSEHDKLDNNTTQEGTQKSGELQPRTPSNLNLEPVQYLPLSPEVLQSLASTDPIELLAFLDKRHQREIEVQRDKQKQQHELRVQQRKENSDDIQASRDRINKYVFALCLIFIALLLYAGITSDTEIPKLIITLASGAIGGGAVVKSTSDFKRNQNNVESDKG